MLSSDSPRITSGYHVLTNLLVTLSTDQDLHVSSGLVKIEEIKGHLDGSLCSVPSSQCTYVACHEFQTPTAPVRIHCAKLFSLDFCRIMINHNYDNSLRRISVLYNCNQLVVSYHAGRLGSTCLSIKPVESKIMATVDSLPSFCTCMKFHRNTIPRAMIRRCTCFSEDADPKLY